MEYTKQKEGAAGTDRSVLMKVCVPFCVRTCEFCTRRVIGGRDSRRLHFYAMALKKELKANAAEFSDCTVSAIHFGGGIASALTGPDFYEICQMIRGHYNVTKEASITLRASMLDINVANVPYFCRAGVTRYDFELMSLERKDFPFLDYPDATSRMPDVSNIIHAFEKNNIGIVLLYGKNSITELNFRRSLLAFVRSDAAHLILQRYEGSDNARREETEQRLIQARTLLFEYGFHEYTPLHFAKPGLEDAYTLGRMNQEDVIAFGMGASTCFGGVKSINTMDLKTYFYYSSDFTKITADVQSENGERTST